MLALPVIVAALVANGEEIRRPKFNGDAKAPTSVGKGDDDKMSHATNRKADKEAKKNSKLQVKRSNGGAETSI